MSARSQKHPRSFAVQVKVPEIRTYFVTAESEKDAIEQVREGSSAYGFSSVYDYSGAVFTAKERSQVDRRSAR